MPIDPKFLRELAVFLLNYAESVDPQVKPKTVKPKPTNSQQWHSRRLKAIRFVEEHGGTVPKKKFVDFCVKELGYDARGLGSYWNKPEDRRLLHLTVAKDGTEELTTSLRAVDLLVEADAA